MHVPSSRNLRMFIPNVMQTTLPLLINSLLFSFMPHVFMCVPWMINPLKRKNMWMYISGELKCHSAVERDANQSVMEKERHAKRRRKKGIFSLLFHLSIHPSILSPVKSLTQSHPLLLVPPFTYGCLTITWEKNVSVQGQVSACVCCLSHQFTITSLSRQRGMSEMIRRKE